MSESISSSMTSLAEPVIRYDEETLKRLLENVKKNLQEIEKLASWFSENYKEVQKEMEFTVQLVTAIRGENADPA